MCLDSHGFDVGHRVCHRLSFSHLLYFLAHELVSQLVEIIGLLGVVAVSLHREVILGGLAFSMGGGHSILCRTEPQLHFRSLLVVCKQSVCLSASSDR